MRLINMFFLLSSIWVAVPAMANQPPSTLSVIEIFDQAFPQEERQNCTFRSSEYGSKVAHLISKLEVVLSQASQVNQTAYSMTEIKKPT